MSSFQVGSYIDFERGIENSAVKNLQDIINQGVDEVNERVGRQIIVGEQIGSTVSVATIDSMPGNPYQLAALNDALEQNPNNNEVLKRLRPHNKNSPLVHPSTIAEVVSYSGLVDAFRTWQQLRIARNYAGATQRPVKAHPQIVLATKAEGIGDLSFDELEILSRLGPSIIRAFPYLCLGPLRAVWKKQPHPMSDHWAA